MVRSVATLRDDPGTVGKQFHVRAGLLGDHRGGVQLDWNQDSARDRVIFFFEAEVVVVVVVIFNFYFRLP